MNAEATFRAVSAAADALTLLAVDRRALAAAVLGQGKIWPAYQSVCFRRTEASVALASLHRALVGEGAMASAEVALIRSAQVLGERESVEKDEAWGAEYRHRVTDEREIRVMPALNPTVEAE